MAGRGTLVSIALAFALVLLNVSICSCVSITFSSETNVLKADEREKVYSVLQHMVYNDVLYNESVHVDRNYYAGRLFTKYIDLGEKGVVVRLTRWSSECSISMSSSSTTKGRDLLDAWKNLLPQMKYFLVEKGHEWVAASSHTDWIDYYVRKPYNGEKEAPLREEPYKTVSDIGSSGTDCTIQPSMLLSHHSARRFSQLRPGESLLSPDGKYKLTIPQSGRVMARCVLNLEDQYGNTKWQSASSFPQGDCRAAFRTDGTLELWNSNNRIWNSASACSMMPDCAGAASLAFNDGDVKLYRSVDDHLSPYWST